MSTSKNIGGQPVKIIDESGNSVSGSLSKMKSVTLGGVDFNPGFPFQVYVTTGGNITLTPAGNDSTNEQINELERSFYTGTITIAVPDNFFIPGLFTKIIAATTTTTGIIVGR